MSRAWDIVVIGASWGGLHAAGEVLAGLPGDFPVPLLVVQHRAEDSGDLLAALLDRRTPLPVRDAEDKEELCTGCIFVAPRGYHCLVEDGHLALSTEAAVAHSRPSIDVAFESAADTYGARAAGVVLTGANADGAAGLAAIRRRGGLAIVQDPATAEQPAMPRAAIAAADPQVVVALEEVPRVLSALALTGHEAAR